MASARMRRPSASVLPTSTVCPLRILSTSEGRYADPDGMFSAIGTVAMISTGSFSAAAATVLAMTAAAPPMSDFIGAMFAVLMLSPPESKVIPFPTRAIRAFGRAGR